MRIVGLRRGGPTPFDGQYLVEYDPERDGVTPDGRQLLAHILTTTSLADAKRWEHADEVLAEWQRPCERDPHGGRHSGDGVNRPLTAFTIVVADEHEFAADDR